MILIEEVNNYGTQLAYNHDKVLLAKTCGYCKELKGLDEFHKTKRCSTGRVSYCRPCLKKVHHERYRKNTKKVYFTSYDTEGNPISRECSKCAHVLPISNFHKHKKGKDGYNSYCMSCTSNEGLVYRRSVPEKIKERSQRYTQNNKSKIRLNGKIRRYNIRHQRVIYKRYEKEIGSVYKEAERLSEVSGCKYVVDHIIPLKHPNVCGLHLPANLALIPDSVNCSKQNKWDGTYDNLNWKTKWREGVDLHRGGFK